jgi:hypothetical protein
VKEPEMDIKLEEDHDFWGRASYTLYVDGECLWHRPCYDRAAGLRETVETMAARDVYIEPGEVKITYSPCMS